MLDEFKLDTGLGSNGLDAIIRFLGSPESARVGLWDNFASKLLLSTSWAVRNVAAYIYKYYIFIPENVEMIRLLLSVQGGVL